MKINSLQSKNHINVYADKTKQQTSFPIKFTSAEIEDKYTLTSADWKNLRCVDIKTSSLDNKEFLDIFDRVYEKFLLDNPICATMNMEKPKVTFLDSLDVIASYNFLPNELAVASTYKEDAYLACVGDMVGVYPESKLDKCKNCELTKLTPEEKRVFYCAILSHELRHWLQNHMMASCKSTSKESLVLPKITYSLFLNATPQEQTEMMNAAYMSIPPSYAANYKPLTLLESDLLPFRTFSNTELCFSMSKHFDKANIIKLFLTSTNNNAALDDFYLCDPSEIDAYQYELNYLADEMNNADEVSVRSDIIEEMVLDLAQKVDYGLNNMRKFKMPPPYMA